jgi:type I restriction enzyme S subunit
MIKHIPSYPELKYTGLPWLSLAPAHWELHRAKHSFREVDDRSQYGDEELLSVSHKTGVTPRSEKNVTMFMAESYEGHKRCRPGDIVVNTMWAWMAAIGVCRQMGIVSPSYGVYRPRASARFEPRYLDYLLRTEIYRGEYVRASRGITTSRLRLYPPDFLNIPFLQPPIDEQRLIIRFLDWHGSQIDKLIRAKQKLITLAAEKRDITTDEVVHSLDTRSVRLQRIVEKKFRAVAREPEGIYVPIGLFNRGRGIFHKPPTKGKDLGDSSFSWIEDGDLVLSGQFAWEGAISLAGPQDAGCIASHRYHLLRCKPEFVETAYVLSFLRTSFGHLLLNEHSRGAAGRNRPLNANTLLKEKIPVPPEIEQKRLVELVSVEKRLASAVGRMSNRLHEFRERLIVDVVTGKLDVRAVAPLLPEPAGEPEPLEVADELETEDIEDSDLEEAAA